MSIKSKPLRNKCEKLSISEPFSNLSECSLQYKSNEILITYSSPPQLSPSSNTYSISNYNFTQVYDIETMIPSNQISFLAPNELTPSGSSHSPFFPDISQSSIESARNSPINNENPRSESPISVSQLPISLNFMTIEIEENIAEELEEPLPIKRKHKEVNSNLKTRENQQAQKVFCDICQKSIKKKSVKVHNSSKIHQSNLRMT